MKSGGGNLQRRSYFWGVLYGILLTAFSAGLLLDTFVIRRVYTAVQPEAAVPAIEETAEEPVAKVDKLRQIESLLRGN